MTESRPGGGVIAAVARGPAAAAGLQAGDIVLSIDGAPVRDIVDWWWRTEEPHFTVRARRGTSVFERSIERAGHEPLGVTFAEVLFDGIRECDNACAFCFVAGLPAGLRRSLYVRDDDYRLSFLAGNFVTLTNVDDSDVERIVEQRLSPLHVSIHAVNDVARQRLLCPTVEDRALDTLDRLLAERIEAHVQVVLVPGVNDGAVLEETLAYLAERDGVLSVGVVPMGYTGHQTRWTSSFDATSAERVLDIVSAWQAQMRETREVGWVYAADELYLLAGADIPEVDAYDDFPQYENGIGMTSAFRDEFVVGTGAAADDVTVVTGELFAPVMRALLDRVGWSGVRVLPARNLLFGGNVSVAGLLSGRDIVATIVADGAGSTYLVPDLVVNCDGLMLDDMRAAELGTRAAADVRIVGSDAGSLVDALTKR